MASRKRQSIPAVPSVDYPELASTFQAIRKNITELWEELDAKAAKTQDWELIVIIEAPAAAAYRLCSRSFPRTIKKITTRSVSGTGTATFAIDNINLGGAVNSVLASLNTQYHTSHNVMSDSSILDVTFSGLSSLTRTTIIITGTRELD